MWRTAWFDSPSPGSSFPACAGATPRMNPAYSARAPLAWQSRCSRVPGIFLSAYYIAKPFPPAVHLARVRAHREGVSAGAAPMTVAMTGLKTLAVDNGRLVALATSRSV